MTMSDETADLVYTIVEHLEEQGLVNFLVTTDGHEQNVIIEIAVEDAHDWMRT